MLLDCINCLCYALHLVLRIGHMAIMVIQSRRSGYNTDVVPVGEYNGILY